ncbi:hypothetical protein EYF80_013982 [Liparis tanakae]|uniref:Uncharacterized protein n=1 Tax=Liparis tanakae TaxID=230148 RepID=A0A4Z2IE69_9TELE|nr:hypothetical protein EYF80_013982 [Liparis tanakae]
MAGGSLPALIVTWTHGRSAVSGHEISREAFITRLFSSRTFKFSISSFLTTNSSLSRYIPSPPLSDSSSSVRPSMATFVSRAASWPGGDFLDSSLAANTGPDEMALVVSVGVVTRDKQVSATAWGMLGTWSVFIIKPGVGLSEEEGPRSYGLCWRSQRVRKAGGRVVPVHHPVKDSLPRRSFEEQRTRIVAATGSDTTERVARISRNENLKVEPVEQQMATQERLCVPFADKH